MQRKLIVIVLVIVTAVLFAGCCCSQIDALKADVETLKGSVAMLDQKVGLKLGSNCKVRPGARKCADGEKCVLRVQQKTGEVADGTPKEHTNHYLATSITTCPADTGSGDVPYSLVCCE